MSRNIFRLVVAIGIVVGFAGSQSMAQVVAYKAFGDNSTYSPLTGDYGGTGQATHLGRMTFAGNVSTSPTANPLVYDFVIPASDPQVNVAANGDLLFFSGSGQVELIPLEPTFTFFSAVWSGEFVVEGGTGRFAKAGPGPQPLSLTAVNEPFTFLDPEWTFSWTVNGQIRLK